MSFVQMFTTHTKCDIYLTFCVVVLSSLKAHSSSPETLDECLLNSDCIYKTYCCKRRYSYEKNICKQSCVNESCYSNTECGGPGECCSLTDRICTTDGCDQCWSNNECPSGKYCCRRSRREGNICLRGCVNQSCNSNADCGRPGECCSLTRRCTTSCRDECHFNWDCNYGKYCCKSSEGNNCAGNCIGQACVKDRDCGAPNECCSMDGHCTKSCPDECHSNLGCQNGTFCCNQRFSHESSVCKQSCVNESCQVSSDCGGPGEKCCVVARRCSVKKCDECLTNIDCYKGLYCCRRLREHNQCKANCIRESCYWDKDCGGPKECCGDSRKCTKACDSAQECSSDWQCTSPNYCCKKRFHYEVGECKPHCLSEPCGKDNDCGGADECCNSNYQCARCCPTSLATWVIVLIIICALVAFVIPAVILIWCCFRKRPSRFPDPSLIPLQPIPLEPPQYTSTPRHPHGPPPPYNSDEEPH